MKKITLLFYSVIVFQFLTAQYCGSSNPSGSSQCTAIGTLITPGISPSTQNVPTFINGQVSTTVLQFKNYDTIRAFGNLLTIVTLKIDSINNLPSGLCWSTDKTNNRYNNQDDGCIKINGTTCANPGVYRLKIKILVDVGLGFDVPYDADQIGLKYYFRVKNNGDADVTLDTSQTALFTKPSGYSANSTCGNQPLSVVLGVSNSVCSGTVVTLNPVISGGTQPYTFAWSANGNSLSCNNCQNPTATITQNSTYVVTVTDLNSNNATASITYSVTGGNFQISPIGPTTFCVGGNVVLNAGSGYTNYQWSNGLSSSSITVSQSNTYTVTVTANGGCTFTDSQLVTVNSPTITNYQITANGPTSFCSGGTVTLNAGSGFTSYHWSNNSNSQTISVSQTGNYLVTVVGTDGCTYTDAQSINTNTSFSGQGICLVSVDQTSGKNLIAWEKSAGFGIDSFKIYRETSIANVYQLIRQQPFGNFSTYEDGQSNPAQSSNKYVITTVDACGESVYSASHKTIHLTSNLGINNEVNLIWNAYEGIVYPSFNIYRGSNQLNLTQISQVSAGTLSYTDLTPPSSPVYYQIEVVNPLGCVPTAKTESFSSSLSNIVQVQGTGIGKVSSVINMNIYPNPATTQLFIESQAFEITEANIYNATGSLVMAISVNSKHTILNTEALAPGVYIAEVKTQQGSVRKRWVKM